MPNLMLASMLLAGTQPAPPQPAAPPRADAPLASYFSTGDYPPEALRARLEGTVDFRVTVGTDGRVGDCVITRSSGSAALDEATCNVMRMRGRYTPARDAAGNLAIGRDSGRITWRLPANPFAPLGLPWPDSGGSQQEPFTLVRPADYPLAALRARASGRTVLRILATPRGRVGACEVERTSGSVELDAASCRIASQRLRFSPAHDKRDRPICDLYDVEVDWVLPRPGFTVPERRDPPATIPPPLSAQLAAQPNLCPGWTSPTN